MKKNEPKILLFDLETSPLITRTWGRYEQNTLHVQKESQILSCAYKFLGDKEVSIITNKPKSFEGFLKSTDSSITSKVAKLFNEADVIIAHNGDKFDIKITNGKILEHEIPVPPKKPTVDTLKVARKHFRLSSNKLDDLAALLKIGRKKQTGGYSLWEDCMHGKKDAWKKMQDYNKQDVVLLEKVYKRLLPWIDNHPSLALLKGGTKNDCNKCGSENVKPRGIRGNTKTLSQQMHCEDCGGWFLRPFKKH